MGKDKTTADIVSDAEIERVHAHANFGKIPKRKVVDDALESTFAGFSTGYTAHCIIIEHGLAKISGAKRKVKVTPKGIRYLQVMMRNRILAKHNPRPTP
ncbi:MAG: hypothetical protein KGO94_14095 [Alphaproteobacteria bacterium]|nr:hypothetical protein [Alphaproteobacteria bacterium]